MGLCIVILKQYQIYTMNEVCGNNVSKKKVGPFSTHDILHALNCYFQIMCIAKFSIYWEQFDSNYLIEQEQEPFDPTENETIYVEIEHEVRPATLEDVNFMLEYIHEDLVDEDTWNKVCIHRRIRAMHAIVLYCEEDITGLELSYTLWNIMYILEMST